MSKNTQFWTKIINKYKKNFLGVDFPTLDELTYRENKKDDEIIDFFLTRKDIEIIKWNIEKKLTLDIYETLTNEKLKNYWLNYINNYKQPEDELEILYRERYGNCYNEKDCVKVDEYWSKYVENHPNNDF